MSVEFLYLFSPLNFYTHATLYWNNNTYTSLSKQDYNSELCVAHSYNHNPNPCPFRSDPGCRPAGSSNFSSFTVLASSSWKPLSTFSPELSMQGDITALNYTQAMLDKFF